MCSVDITMEQRLHPWVPLPFQMASDSLSVAWPCRSMIRPKACAWLTAATVRDPPSRLRAANPYWAEGFPRFAPKKKRKGNVNHLKYFSSLHDAVCTVLSFLTDLCLHMFPRFCRLLFFSHYAGGFTCTACDSPVCGNILNTYTHKHVCVYPHTFIYENLLLSVFIT